MSREVKEPSWEALQYMIDTKTKEVEKYRKHMEADDLTDAHKDSYRKIIENLEKDIERHKEKKRLRMMGRVLTAEKPYTYDEVYRAYKRKWLDRGKRTEHPVYMPDPEKFLYGEGGAIDIAYDEMLKYLDDDVDLRLHEVEKEKDMSDESETYRDDMGGYPESSVLEEEHTPDEGYTYDKEGDIIDGYSVRDDHAELFASDRHDYDSDLHDIEMSDWNDMAEAMKEMGEWVEPKIEEEPEPIVDDSVIGKLKASVGVPEEFKFADNMTFYTMLRNIFRGKNILVTGPSGCGKSSLGKILAEISNKPFYSFNFGDTMNPSAKILGDTKFSKEDGTYFKQSRFVGAITDNSGAFIMLDEITRDRTGDLANILMPVLDGQKYLALDESDDADIVSLDSNAFFYATANIGREYLGCAHDLDRAWKDRFCGGLYELDYLPQKKEQELIQVRVPQIGEDNARRISEFAKKIRDLYKAEELNVAVSTRMCLTTAELVVDGMTLIDALKHTCLPFYPIQGGDDTERVRVIQTIQSMGD